MFDRIAMRVPRWLGTSSFVFLLLIASLLVATLGSAKLADSKYLSGVYWFFFVSLMLVLVLTSIPKVGQFVTDRLNAFAKTLWRRGSFRSNVIEEMPKFAMIRIAFGIFMIERAFWILYYMFPADWASPLVSAVAILNLIAACLVALGLFTQPAMTYLIFVQWQTGDAILGTSTLGNDIGAMLAILLIVANAGAHLSIDGWLRRRTGMLGRFVSATYFDRGLPATNALQIVKFLMLTAYWCVCVYSLMMHLKESAWMNGSAGPLLLTNNFMSLFQAEFQHFFELGPWAVLIGKVSLWAMLPWYLVVLPFVLLGGWWRTYVIAWGLLFFTLSLFVLQLGWLAEFEFLFFAGLFWQKAFLGPQRSLQIAYDDRCNLCDRTINVVKFCDIFGRTELKPVSKNADWLAQNGIEPAAAMADLHGVEVNRDDHVTKGYEFYLTLSRTIFLLTPAYPVLLLGRWIGLGPTMYRYIADRRTSLFGVCELPTSKPQMAIDNGGKEPPVEVAKRDAIVPVAAHCIALALIYLLLIPIPALNWTGLPLPRDMRMTSLHAQGAAHIYGMTPIDVFNKTDLRMAENWFTLNRLDGEGQETLLPVFNPDGSRRAMHKSDMLYYGTTVRFRRATIGKKGCFFKRYNSLIRKIASYYDDSQTGGEATFVYRQYHQLLPNVDKLVQGNYVANSVDEVCVVQFKSKG